MSPPLPPGPSGLFGLRLIVRLRDDFLGHCVALAREHGDAVHYRLAGMHIVQLTHPDATVEVLATHNKSFQKPAQVRRVLGQWNGNGLVVNEGEPWVRQRRLVQQAFKPQRVASHVAAVARRTGEILDGWTGRGEVDMAAELARLTFGVVAEALFGADVEEKTEAFIQAVAVLNDVALQEMTSPVVLPLWAPTPSKRRLRRAIETIDEIVRGIIAARRRAGEDRGDLLSMLLLAADTEGDGGRMTDEQARDEAVNLMLGGNETTATALTWTAHLLSLHPEIQEEAAAEVEEVLGGRVPAAQDLPRLGRATNAFKEAMRLYPPAYVLPRVAVEGVTIGGFHIPRGSTVNLVPFVTHRDARWFEDPEAFRPSRFEKEEGFRRGAYLPFGLGPRACVGRSLAMLEGTAITAMLLQRYRLRPAAAAGAVEMEAQVSLHPKGGLRVAVEAR